MRTLRYFFSKIIKTGLDREDSYISQKETTISNKISLVLIPLILLGLGMSYMQGVIFTAFGFGLVLIFLIATFPLNYFGKSVITRFGLSILLPMLLLIPNLLGGIGKEENYLVFSYLFIGFSIIPLILFQDKKNFGLLMVTLVINLLTIMFFDVLLIWSDVTQLDLSFIEENYTYYKLPQIVLWLIIVASFQFQKQESNKYRIRLENSNKSLKESNKQVRIQNEEILAQNVELSKQKLNIEVQKSKLSASNNELKNTKLELLNTIDKLKDARDKILQQEAEAKSIFNALNDHYLVAQYNLNGKLVSINSKVIELLGVIKEEHIADMKSMVTKTNNKESKSLNGKYFSMVWERVLRGEAQTIELEFTTGNGTKNLATTFAPLFDEHNKPSRVLAIGHDVSELVDKNEKIDKINEELKEKIFEISQKNELLNFQQGQIFEYSEELHKQKEEIQAINDSLEERVKERTSILEEKNKQLTEYAFINSHVLRSPVSTIIGLINLMSYSSLPEEDKKIYEHLQETSKVLDNIVFKIHNAIDTGVHFNRGYLEPDRNNRSSK